METGSINSYAIDSETSPIASTRTRLFRRFGAMIGPGSTTTSPDGYVEFGITNNERSTKTLGTFAGVFSPVALSMFSALLFIRVGFLVGNAGLYTTLMQFVIAYLILIFTVTSVCAISTNGAVEGGGVYFMISRTLGPEFGGSIGTLFFLANVVGSALAITGCAEGIVENLGPTSYYGGTEGLIPDSQLWRFLYCTLINTLMLIVCLIGASLFAKTSVLILGIVIVCLLSTFISFLTRWPMQVGIPERNTLVQNDTAPAFGNYTGLRMETLQSNLLPNYGKDYTADGSTVTFAIVFGVLFSGVTGIMAGANMSGELKNPSRSIPRGTLSAVAFTFCTYILLSLGIAATSDSFLLQNNFLFLMPINIWPGFVAVGILTATFSTALSNLIGSSRVLEALAKDRVYGSTLSFIQRGTWKGNPIAAIFVSWTLVECILLIGSLNLIAQINSVLFMLSYLATNLACLAIELTGAPNFRPSFKYFTWHTCVLGLLGTLIMMFVINPIYASLSIIMCLILVIGLHIFSPTSQDAQWGSISQALMFHQVRKYLLMLDSRKDHVKFWRPQMLLLVSSPRSCCPLIDFVNDLKKGGLYVIGHVQKGEFNTSNVENDPTIEAYKDWIALIDHLRIKAFAEITMAKTIRDGVQHLIRISGIGAMKPNTIIFGFYDPEIQLDFLSIENSPYKSIDFNNKFALPKPDDQKSLGPSEYVAMICDVLRMNKNLCLCRHFHRMNKKKFVKDPLIKFIDVWPINFLQPKAEDPFDVVSLFMLQLSCIINMLPLWKRLHLRVFLPEEGLDEPSFNVDGVSVDKKSDFNLRKLLVSLRISASIYQIPELNFKVDVNPSSMPYVRRVNEVIRYRSNETACTFIYLPTPPTISSNNSSTSNESLSNDWNQKSIQYLQYLTELTADLPPTILVHGVSAVTSTTL